MIKEISKRNAETLEQVIRDQNEKIEAQTIRINNLERTLGNVLAKVEILERTITSVKAASTGHGPSVK